MPWDPDQYHKFQAERFAPFDDLIRLVRVRAGMRAVDLGCGTGELTARLADHLPGSEVLGVDSSPEMLAKAQPRRGLRFEAGDLREVRGPWDLIFSHAALQWVDDHETLIPRLMGKLAAEGQIVVQQPSNHAHPAHRAIPEVAGEEPFRSALEGWTRRSPVLAVDRYAELLHAAGARDLTVFEKVYPHVLPDADAVAEWTRGTALLPYLDRLPEPLRGLFLERYRDRLGELFPGKPVFYGFRRIFFAATREGTG